MINARGCQSGTMGGLFSILMTGYREQTVYAQGYPNCLPGIDQRREGDEAACCFLHNWM